MISIILMELQYINYILLYMDTLWMIYIGLEEPLVRPVQRNITPGSVIYLNHLALCCRDELL